MQGVAPRRLIDTKCRPCPVRWKAGAHMPVVSYREGNNECSRMSTQSAAISTDNKKIISFNSGRNGTLYYMIWYDMIYIYSYVS